MSRYSAARVATRAPARAWAQRHDIGCLRHGRARPATRPGQACDTAGPGLRHGAVCAQAGSRVCT